MSGKEGALQRVRKHTLATGSSAHFWERNLAGRFYPIERFFAPFTEQQIRRGDHRPNCRAGGRREWLLSFGAIVHSLRREFPMVTSAHQELVRTPSDEGPL